MPTVNDLRAKRAEHLDLMTAVAGEAQPDAARIKSYDDSKAAIAAIDGQLARFAETEGLAKAQAIPVGGQLRVPAAIKSDPYVRDPSLAVGGMVKMVAMAKGDVWRAAEYAVAIYGEGHPVAQGALQAKALATLTGPGGGFLVPPDFVDTLIPLLYAKSVVRAAGAIVTPMPNGTMSIPKMTGGTTAYWVGETKPIAESAPTFGQVAAVAHKLAALVPISNDQMRYASPNMDGLVRDDVVKQMALAEDLAFIRGTGTQFSPRGLLSFATVLGKQLLASTSPATTQTTANELGGLVNKVETSNVAMSKPGWLMSPRTKNYLLNLQNTNGMYIYKDEMTGANSDGKTLLSYPYYTTTQIPTNLVVGAATNCSEIYFVDFAECLILESRSLEFAISTEGTYTDANGQVQSAFQNDLTIIRAITAEDFQLRHDEAVAVDQGVTWSPAIQ